jgi:hypothetical protein
MRLTDGLRIQRIAAIVLGVAFVPAAALAQWTQIPDVPTTQLFSLSAKGDTICAGADTAVYLSTDAGASWRRSAIPAPGVASIQGVLMRNGRLYAGTFGQGVFVSDDLGATWQAFNQGLVGGILDTQLDISDLLQRGDSIYVATSGAGVYVRGLAPAGTWQHFGEEFEPNQASNVNTLALGGGRLLAMAGANGAVFRRDPGDAEWTISNLDNVGIHAGLGAQNAAWTGTGWIVGTNLGLFLSLAGEEPWTRVDPGFGVLDWTTFAVSGGHLFGAFSVALGAITQDSGDNGATWQNAEFLSGVFVKSLAISGNQQYAARGDGLWRHAIETTGVPIVAGHRDLRFALVGPQPFVDRARLRFDLPEAARASIDVFDVAGRRVGERIDGWWSAGSHEVSLDARPLSPGIYAARLTTAGRSEFVRLVHVR